MTPLVSDFPFTEEGSEYFAERISKDDGCVILVTLGDEVIGYLIGGICDEEF